MKIALDTNVVISGLLSPYGKPAQIMRMVSSGEITLSFDARILTEYQEVLLRPKFEFNREKVGTLLTQIKYMGEIVSTVPLKKSLPDPDDNPFLEVAIAGKVKFLVTGNLNHFPKKLCQNVEVLSPSDFLKEYIKSKDTT
jgi:putative PIN family toxin of toxin-antitoxin system